MIRWLVVLSLCLTGCYGTLDVGDDVPADPEPIATDGYPNAPADTATPQPTATPNPAPAEEQPQPGPQPEPEPEPQPDPEPEPEPEPALPEPGSTVVFEIPQGTGSGAWNTPDNPVVVYVGQILRITNLDDRNHRMHATDDAPVPHGGDLVPGQSEDYMVDAPLTVSDSAEAWDHDDGRSAAFWIEAREYPTP